MLLSLIILKENNLAKSQLIPKQFVLLFFCLFSFSLPAQEIEWQKTFGSLADDNLNSIINTSDGGYILGGTSDGDISGDKSENSIGGNDYWVIKTDSTGNIQWQNTIGGTSGDDLYIVIQTNDGCYILAGSSSSNISGDKTENSNGGKDYWIVKIDTTGNLLWQNTIGGSGADNLNSAQQTLDGGFILGGYSNSNISGDKTENSNGLYDFWIVKIDSLGNIEWQKTIGGNDSDMPYSIEQTNDSGFIVAGRSESNISGDKTENCIGLNDYWIVKTNSVGNIQWQNTIGGIGNDYLNSIKQTFDGGYILGGTSGSGISGDKTESALGVSDYWIVKTDSVGIIQWQNTIGGNQFEDLYSAIQISDSGYFLGGSSYSNISGDKLEDCQGLGDFWIIKTDALGNIQWQNSIGGSSDDILRSIQQTTNGGYIIGGSSNSLISPDKIENCVSYMDYWILKISDKFNLVEGKLFLDMNSNSIQDSGEVGIVNHIINENNTGRKCFSKTGGEYDLSVLDSGNFIIRPNQISHYSIVPSQQNITFNGIMETDSLNDFAFQPNGVIDDLQININQVGSFRPGRSACYNIHYKNVGTTSIAGSVTFFIDSLLTFVSASIVPNQITPDSLVWQIPTLEIFEEGNIFLTIYIDPTATIGSIINSMVKIEPIASDATPNNNVAEWQLVVTGSHDPNNILVNHSILTTINIADSLPLEYIIHFQNVGTDTAFSVLVQNSLPDNTDASSFEFIEASHPVTLHYFHHEKIMQFRFNNILLVDSNMNEPLSHGYLRYRISPVTTLAVGDSILNSADIIFDSNFPVRTNQAITLISLPVSISELNRETGFLVYPNPASNEINIFIDVKKITKATAKIYDALGRMVMQSSEKNFQIGSNKLCLSTSSLIGGIYYLVFSSDENAYSQKIIIE